MNKVFGCCSQDLLSVKSHSFWVISPWIHFDWVFPLPSKKLTSDSCLVLRFTPTEFTFRSRLHSVFSLPGQSDRVQCTDSVRLIKVTVVAVRLLAAHSADSDWWSRFLWPRKTVGSGGGLLLCIPRTVRRATTSQPARATWRSAA